MNTEVNTALKRLNSILPLISGLESLNGDDAALYCKLINSYVQQGRTLTREEVDELVGNAEQALTTLWAAS